MDIEALIKSGKIYHNDFATCVVDCKSIDGYEDKLFALENKQALWLIQDKKPYAMVVPKSYDVPVQMVLKETEKYIYVSLELRNLNLLDCNK